MADAELQQKLVQQLEFYFGDANLSKDRFLRQKLEESSDGVVAIETVAAFNRMKQLTNDVEAIRSAIAESPKLRLGADGRTVGRVDPLPEPRNVDDRTIYAEHLPPKVSHDMMRELFAPFGKIEYISIPRFPDRSIKGFAFVEYAEPIEAQAAAAGTVTFKDGDAEHTVKVLHKTEWFRLRQEYAKLQRQLQKEMHTGKDHAHSSHGKLKPEKKSAVIEDSTVVRLNNVNPDTRKSKIKEAFDKVAEVAYVDFVIGRPIVCACLCKNAHVRFKNAAGARKLIAEVKGMDTTALRDGDSELQATLLEGEVMNEYRKRVDVIHSKRLPKNETSAEKEAPTADVVEDEMPGEVAAEGSAKAQNKKKNKKSAKKAKQHMRFDGGVGGTPDVSGSKDEAESEPTPPVPENALASNKKRKAASQTEEMAHASTPARRSKRTKL